LPAVGLMLFSVGAGSLVTGGAELVLVLTGSALASKKPAAASVARESTLAPT